MKFGLRFLTGCTVITLLIFWLITITVHGAIREVFLRGKRMVSEGRVLGRPGDGLYLARSQRQFCL